MAGAHQLSHDDRRGQPELGPLGQLTLGEPHRIPPDEGFDGGERWAVGDPRENNDPTVQRRPTEGGGRQPPTQRLDGGVQLGPTQGGPSIQQQARGIPLGGSRLRPRRRDDQRRGGRHLTRHLTGCRGDDRDAREGSSQLLRRPAAAEDRRAPGRAVALRTAEPGDTESRAAPRAGRRVAWIVLTHRAVTGGAAHRCSADLAGQRGAVTAAGHLDEHRAAGQPLVDDPPGTRWQLGPGSSAVALPPDLPFAGDDDPRGCRTEGRRGGTQVHHSPGRHPALHLNRAAEPADQQRCGRLLGPNSKDGPHLRVGRSGLGEQIVTVVPPRDQAQIAHGREGRSPGADDDAHVPPQELEPGRVTRLRPLVGGEANVPTSPEDRSERLVDPDDIAVVGDDDHRPTAGRQRGRRRLGKRSRPVLLGGTARDGQPGSPWSAARRDPTQERLTRRVCRPRPGLGAGRLLGSRRLGRRWHGWVEGQRAFSGGMTLGDREAQHVAEDPAVAVGDRPGEGVDLRGENGFGAHDPTDRREPAGVLGLRPARDDEAVQIPPGEADPDPHPRLGGGVQLGRDGILERTVQVGEPTVDDNGCHREGAGGVVDRHAGTLTRRADTDSRGHSGRTAPANETMPGSNGTRVHW